MVKVWQARECVIKISDAIADASIDTSTLLDTEVAAANGVATITSNVKNVTISVPEGSVEKIDLLGESNSAAGDNNDFQNAELDIKPWGMATITGTIVQPGDEVFETWALGAGTAIAATHHRYQYGGVAASKVRKECALLVNLDDATDEVNILLNHAYITKLGDKTISGADSHWEQSFEAVCLPKDYYEEYKD